jgi:hypothetical protein
MDRLFAVTLLLWGASYSPASRPLEAPAALPSRSYSDDDFRAYLLNRAVSRAPIAAKPQTYALRCFFLAESR